MDSWSPLALGVELALVVQWERPSYNPCSCFGINCFKPWKLDNRLGY